MADISIQIGQVLDDDSQAAYLGDDQDSSWRDCRVHNHYSHNLTRYVLGVTAEEDVTGDTSAFVQLSKGWLIWIADWTISRAGKVPPVPDTVPADIMWKLLDYKYQLNHITLAADGITPVYRISGTYVYGHRKPSVKALLDARVARQPWVEDRFVRRFTEKDFMKNVIDGGNTGPSSPSGGGFGPVFVR